MNTKYIIGIVCGVVVAGLLLAPIYVYAADPNIIAPLNKGGMKSPVSSGGQIIDIILSVVQWMYTILFILAVLFILIAAYNFILGGTDPKKIDLAKLQLRYAVYAIVVALIAGGVALIINRFLADSIGPGPGDPVNPNTPGIPRT